MAHKHTPPAREHTPVAPLPQLTLCDGYRVFSDVSARVRRARRPTWLLEVTQISGFSAESERSDHEGVPFIRPGDPPGRGSGCVLSDLDESPELDLVQPPGAHPATPSGKSCHARCRVPDSQSPSGPCSNELACARTHTRLGHHKGHGRGKRGLSWQAGGKLGLHGTAAKSLALAHLTCHRYRTTCAMQ